MMTYLAPLDIKFEYTHTEFTIKRGHQVFHICSTLKCDIFYLPEERISDSSKRSFSKSSSSDSISGIPLLRREGTPHERIAGHDNPHMPKI